MENQTIGPYRLDGIIGYGTVGTVHRAHDTQKDRRVALKILLPAMSENDLVASRFRREIKILEKLEHEHIVRYYGSGHEGHRLYFAMELVEGGSVKQMLSNHGRLTWTHVAELACQVASALQYAHNHGIIHRDLKPSNLLLTPSGLSKLTDFGVARDTTASDITASGLTVGTHAYMAPEQIRGARNISGQTDLYSLGCVMFEMLTGRVPFPGENFAAIFDQHLHQPPPSPQEFAKDCPPPLAELVLNLMAKTPEQRPFNARAVQGLLYGLLEADCKASRAELRREIGVRTRPLRIVSSSGLSDGYPPSADDVSWSSLAWLGGAVAAFTAAYWWLQS